MSSLPGVGGSLTDVSGSYEIQNFDIGGDFGPFQIWPANTAPGNYYVFVDENRDGIRQRGEKYDAFTVTQYVPPTATVTFYQVGVGAGFTGTVLTVDGVNYGASAAATGVTITKNVGDSISFTYHSPLAVDDKRYVWTNTAGLSNAQSGSIIVPSGGGSVTGNYKTQWRQTFDASSDVKSDGTGKIVTVNDVSVIVGSLTYRIWADHGSTISYSYESIVSSTVSGKRYRLDSVTGPSSGYTVYSANTITGNYVAQYQVTFAQTGLNDAATGTVVTIDSVTKTKSDLPFTDWFDGGTTYSYSSIVSSTVTDKRFRLDGVTGPVSPITSSGTVTGNYVAQYLVTFTQSGLDATATGTVLTVASAAKTCGELPFTTDWLDHGFSLDFAYSNPVASSVSGKQFGLVKVSHAPPLDVTAPTTVTGTYKTQYYLTVNTNPAEVLTLNPSAVSGVGWYDADTTATVDAVQLVDKVTGESRYDFRSWTGAAPIGRDNQATVLMDGPKTATANYQLQHLVTFDQSGLDETAIGKVVTVNGVAKGYGDLPYDIWVDEGAKVTYEYENPVSSNTPGMQFWLSSVTGPASSFAVSASTTVIGNYLKLPYSAVTTSGLCPISQFKLLFIQDMQNPSTYRLTASNPGQFYYNVFYIGAPETTVTLTINIPAPFVTQGAMPVHVYSGVSISGGCFVPSGKIGSYAYTITGLSGGTIELTVTVPSSGLVYVAVHLDFGYKITPGWTPDGGLNAYLNGELTIRNNSPYTFSYSAYSANGVPYYATVNNVNDFKKIPGFGGVVTDSHGNPISGATVTVVVDGKTFTATTNNDGFYLIVYKTGKTQRYTITVTKNGCATRRVSGTIYANKFVVNNFIL